MNFYIVTFDRQPSVSYRQFHNDFVKHPQIGRWWHYIQSSYIIGTELTEDQLADHFTTTATKHGIPVTHLVLKVDLSKRQGRLLKDAWKWLRENTRI